ncbi:hypothetical protein Dimus_001541 [Dionaea muscipula]
MSMMVFQELRLCYESKPTSLHIKAASTMCSTTSSWSCIQAISTMNSNECKKKDEDLYVHPLMKRASSMLSNKSLEMCTENLGSETGTDDGIFLSTSSSSSPSSSTAREIWRGLNPFWRVTPREHFPPPLTTISGSNSILIRSQREGGRLVMEAYSAPPRHCHIHAERTGGRLRLSLMRDYDAEDDCPDSESKKNEIVVEAAEEDEELVVEQEEEEEEEEEENVVAKQDESEVYMKWGMEGINWKVEGKIEISAFQRPSGCKERSNKILMNHESFWVGIYRTRPKFMRA